MNVSLTNKNEVSAQLKVKIEKGDYAELLKASLRKLRQKAQLQGFRQGMVPIELIKKLYGKQALAEELNRMVPEQINAYLRDNQIKIIGEPIPDEAEQKRIDFDVDEDFEFCYDLALLPNLDFQLTKADSLTTYRIIVDDEMVEKQIDSYRKTYGSQEVADTIAAEDLVKGTLVEMEDKAPKAGGIVVEDTTLMPSYMKGKLEQKKLIGAKTGSVIVFNPYKAFKGTEVELASLLQIDKAAVKEMKSDFSFEIKEISRFRPAELNQEFFDRILGPEAAQDETAFREKFKSAIIGQYDVDTKRQADVDKRNMLIQKADVQFADEILKRWLLFANEKTTAEEVENDFPKVIEDLKYHLAKEKLVRENEIKVTNEEVEAMAKRVVNMQYAQYGVFSVPDETMDLHVKEMMKKQETVNNLVDRILDEKVFGWMNEQITIVEQEVTFDDFIKLTEKQN